MGIDNGNAYVSSDSTAATESHPIKDDQKTSDPKASQTKQNFDLNRLSPEVSFIRLIIDYGQPTLMLATKPIVSAGCLSAFLIYICGILEKVFYFFKQYVGVGIHPFCHCAKWPLLLFSGPFFFKQTSSLAYW